MNHTELCELIACRDVLLNVRRDLQERIDEINGKIERAAVSVAPVAVMSRPRSAGCAKVEDYGFIYADWQYDRDLWDWYGEYTAKYSKKIRLIKAVREIEGISLADAMKKIEAWAWQ